MNRKNVLLVGAAVLLGLAAFGIQISSLVSVPAALCLVVLAQLGDED